MVRQGILPAKLLAHFKSQAFYLRLYVNIESKNTSSVPQHVAIIMDGNGRWAQQRGLPRIEGHRRGAEAVKRTLQAAQENGVRCLTLYAFSVENWNRPQDEVDALMKLLGRFLDEQLPELMKRNIRLRVVGRYQELPEEIQERLRDAESKTAEFKEYTVGLALNYGSRTEIVDAVKSVAEAAKSGSLNLDAFDYDQLRGHLYTGDMPDPDLIIRTSGECRLSNFLMLQAAYAEIFISKLLWPEFDQKEFKAALNDYAGRERRYGKTTAQITKG